MARRAYLRFLSTPDGPVEVAVSDGRSVDLLPGGLKDLKLRDGVVVFVPGTEVGWYQVAIPARSEREARRAAPFAIEDELAASTETTHVAVSERDEANTRIVLICEEALMKAWSDRLKTEGIGAEAIVPEFAVLPAEDCLADLGERFAMRINGRPMGLDRDGPSDLMRAIVASANGEVAIHGTSLAARMGVPAGGEVHSTGIETLVAYADRHGIGTDMRQGRFASQQGLALPDLKTWRMPLATAAAAAVAWLGLTAWETASLGEESRSLRAKAGALYSDAFAGEGSVPDPASRTQAKLAQGAGSTLDFERATAVLFQTLEDVDGARLRSMRFDGPGGELRASVDYASYGDDLKLAESLGSAGLFASLGDTRASGSSITGDVTIRAVP